jgi:hypothetical protein
MAKSQICAFANQTLRRETFPKRRAIRLDAKSSKGANGIIEVRAKEARQMIYGRFGDEIEIVRVAVLADVKRLDKRKPDKHDKQRVADGCYIVTRSKSADDPFGGDERLHDICYMRADGGFKEITEAIRRLSAQEAWPG